MFVVMGATGQTGGAAVAELKRLGAPVRALTRDPARASHLGGGSVEVLSADTADPDSLAAAFKGADAAYVLVPPDEHAPDALAAGRATSEAIAKAVEQAGVSHVVALSSGGAHLTEGTGLLRTLYDLETALRRTKASITVIRAADFMENWASVLPVAREQGILPSVRMPLDAKVETVSTGDIGRTAATCLLERQDGERVINLVGPDEYSPQDAAAAFSDVLGRPVEAVPMPHEAQFPAYVGAGMGEDYARGLVALYDAVNAGVVVFEPGVGETRRGTTSLVEAVRKMVG